MTHPGGTSREVATLDPFHGYKNAIDDQLQDARAVLDAFHVVKLATQAIDEVRRRAQQDIHGHRGRRDDPLYRIRNLLRAGQENLTDRHFEVEVAWRCSQQVRAAYHQDTHTAGRAITEQILDSFASCSIRKIARLGRTLKIRREAFMGYFDTGGSNNGGTEAMCECAGGWSGTGWSGWCWSCRSERDSRSYWPAHGGVFPLNCPLGSARPALSGPPR